MNLEKIEFLVHFICESDAIENIADDRALVRSQLRGRRKRGHVGAILLLGELASRKELLTEDVIKRVQSLIVTEQPKKGQRKLAKKHRGQWRDCNMRIGDRVCVSWAEVHERMNTLIEETAHWQKTCGKLSAVQRVAAIARFHYAYEDIHPFADGNGRSGRALVYYLYRFCDLEPFIFTADDRHEAYYPCFRDSMAPLLMEEYFLSRTTILPR